MTQLARLAFGNNVHLDAASDLTNVLVTHTSARIISLPDAPRDFSGLMAMAQVNDLVFGAYSHTPITVEVGEAPGNAVMIPCSGSLAFTVKQHRFMTHAGHSLAILAGQNRFVETSGGSHVAIPFDRSCLIQTAKTMLGLGDGNPIELNLDQERDVSLSPMGLSMGTVFENLFQIIDALPSANLALLNLDDLFYRSLAVMLSPQVAQAFASPAVERRPRPIRREIGVACEYIQAHLAEPISLTELEQVSGLSARSLQIGFQQQFQCSPMQWVRRERFALARRLLLAATPDDSVTTIALNCGFTQLGTFARGYRAIFGEFPSATLCRVQR